MDWLIYVGIASLGLIALYLFYCFIFLIIIFTAQSDALTFLARIFGKRPSKIYKGKVVWVTGASSGIGEGFAKELAKCNAKIVISARREDELIRVKKDCLALNSKLKDEDILIIPLDMVNLSTHQPSLDKIIDHFGKLDVLISNAGRSIRANWQDVDIQVDKDLFELNVFSVINMNRIVLKYFNSVGQGTLAVTSSATGKIGMPQVGTYAASKHAIHGYFEGLRAELYNSNINVILFVVGPVATGLFDAAFSEKIGQAVDKKYAPVAKRMTPEKCAHLGLVAMANGLDESWISILPIIPLLYANAYYSYLTSKLKAIVIGRFGSVGISGKAKPSQDA